MSKCKNCGKYLGDESNRFCPNCGTKLDVEKVLCDESALKNKHEKTTNKKILVGDITRYIFGGLFCLGGISVMEENWYGVVQILLGLSFFPFIYRKYISKIIKNFKLLKILQIFLPICLFVLLFILIPVEENDSNSFTPTFKTETAEEKALRIVRGKLYPSYQIIDSYEINSDTGNYDFKIKETKTDLTAYTCASDLHNLVEQVVGLEKVGSIQFECVTNNQTFYYVLIDNISVLTSDQINNNTKYFDSNYNVVNTNINILKENAVNDYKKACSSYKYKDVLRNPSDYKDKKAYWSGEIVQVVDKSAYSSTFRIDVTCEKYTYSNDYYCDDTLYVTYYGDESFIEDDMVKMWGTLEETETYTTVLGASVTIPKFHAVYMELQ